MEFTNVHVVAGLGFLLAAILGAILNKTGFCTMGAVSDLVNMGLNGRLASWALAMGIAILGAQLLELSGLIELDSSIYRNTSFAWFSYVVGGFCFGVGMTLSGGCGQRSLVRLGNGNLKSLVVVLVLGITAYMTLRGLLGVARVSWFNPVAVDLEASGIADQGIATLLASALSLESGQVLRWIVAGVLGLGLIIWAWRQPALREHKDNVLAGISVGVAIVLAWVITGIVGLDDFDPVPLESMTFVSPTGNAINYLMTYTGATINFGIAIVFGLIAGSFLYGIASRTFRIETFNDRGDMIGHLGGAALMGFGGVLALGCTVGQGIAGISTLALGSFIAVASIIFGSAVTMKVQYHRMDDLGFFSALGKGIMELLMPWRNAD